MCVLEILAVVEVEVQQQVVAAAVIPVYIAVAFLIVGYVAVGVFYREAAQPCLGRECGIVIGVFAVGVVITEVEVGAEVAQERHLQVELQVADRLPYVRLVVVVVDKRHRVHGLQGVDVVAGSIRTGYIACVDVCCPVVEHVALGVLDGQCGVE